MVLTPYSDRSVGVLRRAIQLGREDKNWQTIKIEQDNVPDDPLAFLVDYFPYFPNYSIEIGSCGSFRYWRFEVWVSRSFMEEVRLGNSTTFSAACSTTRAAQARWVDKVHWVVFDIVVEIYPSCESNPV